MSRNEIVTHIIGKWKTTRIDGQAALTNERMVVTYHAGGRSERSISGSSITFNYNVEGNVITEKEEEGGTAHVFESSVNGIDGMFLDAQVRHSCKGVVKTDERMAFSAVKTSFSTAILGLWEGVECTGPVTYGDSNHRWEFLEDGTFIYYSKDTDGKWVKSADTATGYIVDGDWLYTGWTDEKGTEYSECWDISSCDSRSMTWTAQREDKDGKKFKTTFTLKKMTANPEDDWLPLNLASFNIRYNSADDTGSKDWSSSRKTLVCNLVKDRDFDVCGFVEITQPLMKNDLKELLGDTYTFKICGRTDGGANGEAVGFGFKTSKFTMEKSGYFFLNTHPDRAGEATEWYDPVPDKAYGRSRIAAWGLLKEKESGKRFLYITTHLELN